jgi:hypothetical protein
MSRESFLRAKDVVIEAVTFPDSVPELGGQTMYVRTMKARDRDMFEGSRVRLDKDRNAELVTDNTRARMVSMTACDQAGVLLFTETDIDALGEKNALAMDVLYDAALRINAMRTQDLEKKLKN